jgi:rod shape-determining protein MreB
MDDAIVRSIHQRERLLVGQEQAEVLKIGIGSATAGAEAEEQADIAGRDLNTGLLRRTSISALQIREALQRPLEQIVAAVKELLDRTPAELSADVIEQGITLVGGGALLPGLDTLLETETGLQVRIAESPLTSVALGAGQALEELGSLRPPRRRRNRN